MLKRISRLPKDSRGYPIPWNVLRAKDGSPIFTVNDDRKHFEAIRCGLCPICGGKLGKWKWFIGGPLSAFDPNGWYLDLPAHRECAEFSLSTCPYLAAPKYLKRVDIPDPSKLPDEMPKIFLDNTVISERPEVMVAVAGSEIEFNPRSTILTPYVRPKSPVLGYQYWLHGQRLKDAEGEELVRKIVGEEIWSKRRLRNNNA